MTGDLKASSEGEDSPDGKTPQRPHAVCVWGGDSRDTLSQMISLSILQSLSFVW